MKLIILIILSTTLSFAKLSIILPLIEHYSSGDSPGYINKLSELTTLSQQNIKYLPLKRLLFEFQNKSVDCMVGGDKSISKLFMPELNFEKIINSKPFLVVRSKIFSKKEICDPKELKGKKITIHSGFPIQLFIKLEELESYTFMNSRLNAFKMVESGRADAFVGFVPTAAEAKSDLKFCKDKSLTKHYETIQCFKTEESIAFIKSFNKDIRNLNKSGKLKKLIKKYFPVRYKEFSDELIFIRDEQEKEAKKHITSWP